MVKPRNTTVSVPPSTSEVLTLAARAHNMSKADLVSYLVAFISTKDKVTVDEILTQGKLVHTILVLGGVSQYPNGISLGNLGSILTEVNNAKKENTGIDS